MVDKAIPENAYPEQWDITHLKDRVSDVFGLQVPVDQWLQEEAVEPQMIAAARKYAGKVRFVTVAVSANQTPAPR